MDRRVFVKTPAEHRHGGRGICLSGKTTLGTCTNTRKKQTKVSQGLSDEGRRGVKTHPSVIKPPPPYIHTHTHHQKNKDGFQSRRQNHKEI